VKLVVGLLPRPFAWEGSAADRAARRPRRVPLTDTNPVDGARGQQAFNSVDYNSLLRAALVRMDRWVTGEEDPPPSRYPRLADGTAVAPEQPREVFAAIPGIGFPLHPPQVIRLAFGPDAASGKGSRTAYPNCPTRENQIARPGAAARGKETDGRRGVRCPGTRA